MNTASCLPFLCFPFIWRHWSPSSSSALSLGSLGGCGSCSGVCNGLSGGCWHQWIGQVHVAMLIVGRILLGIGVGFANQVKLFHVSPFLSYSLLFHVGIRPNSIIVVIWLIFIPLLKQFTVHKTSCFMHRWFLRPLALEQMRHSCRWSSDAHLPSMWYKQLFLGTLCINCSHVDIVCILLLQVIVGTLIAAKFWTSGEVLLVCGYSPVRYCF